MSMLKATVEMGWAVDVCMCITLHSVITCTVHVNDNTSHRKGNPPILDHYLGIGASAFVGSHAHTYNVYMHIKLTSVGKAMCWLTEWDLKLNNALKFVPAQHSRNYMTVLVEPL